MITVILTLFFIAGAMVPAAFAGEKESPELSLNESIALALDNSESIDKAGKEIEKKKEWLEYRQDQLDYIPAKGVGTALVEVPWAQALTANLEYSMSKRSLTAEEDKVVLDTCNKYWNILKAQEMLKVAQLNLDSALAQLQNARVSYQVGMIDNSKLIAAEAQYEGAQTRLSAAQNDLDNAYMAFNQLVGLWPEDRPVLTDELEYAPLEVNDLDYEVARVLSRAPNVWQAEQMVTLQGYLEDMIFYTGEYRPYQARKIEVEQAELDAASTKEYIENLTRSLYYGIKSLEEAYNGALEQLKVEQENLRVTKVKFELGMATKSELIAAEKALLAAESSAFDLVCQHAYMKLAFEKPWAI